MKISYIIIPVIIMVIAAALIIVINNLPTATPTPAPAPVETTIDMDEWAPVGDELILLSIMYIIPEEEYEYFQVLVNSNRPNEYRLIVQTDKENIYTVVYDATTDKYVILQ